MSTLKVSTLQNASSATANITLDTAGNATVGGTLAMGSSFLRNRLINGGMNVYQRGSVSATTSGAYTLDRWFVTPTGATVTVTQSTSTVPSNFTASLNVASAASVTNVSVYQRIESLNCQDFSSGAVVTVSGWIRQSTGSAVTTATVALTTPTASDNYTSTSSAASTYTIPSIANATWVYFSNAFTLTTGCTNGLQVTIALGAGLTTGGLNLTGVQLEVGSVATPFERRQYGQELALCYRYYEVAGFGLAGAWEGASIVQLGWNFSVQKRAAATVSILKTNPLVTQVGVADRTGSSSALTGSSGASSTGSRLIVSGFSGSTAQNGAICIDSSNVFSASAEL